MNLLFSLLLYEDFILSLLVHLGNLLKEILCIVRGIDFPSSVFRSSIMLENLGISKDLNDLFDLALQAKALSYSPYSKFRVGCALRTSSGKIFQGSNIENASYPLSLCAERTAIVKAVSEGERILETIVVASDLSASFCSPCGACRQVMSEFGEPIVYLIKPDKSYRKFLLRELLPFGFSSNDLRVDNISTSALPSSSSSSQCC